MTDSAVWIALARAAGALAGWLLAHRGFRRGLRELERYLEHWLEAEAKDVVDVAAAVVAPRRVRR